jgi:uroporphyrinogen-III synthase
MREENLHLPPKIVIASIGPVTSFTLRDLGAPVHVQPAEHTLAAMVTDLSKYFRDHAPRTGLR